MRSSWRPTSTACLKRVAAVAGGRPPPGALPEPVATADDRVPAGALVLLGDNTDNSYDSRQAGYFATTHVLGTVLRPRPPGRSERRGTAAFREAGERPDQDLCLPRQAPCRVTSHEIFDVVSSGDL
ncbi:S26 family signal peptidase [Streptomyces sp. CA-288835]|uniref:S26 family signal peptidase n=1 Tax=Streptomyces sp. CA-288835 TaxID=3240069 RepID=UPI003D8CD985